MLNISGIQEGYVLDHIKAGMSLRIYHDLKLDKLNRGTVAIIMNAVSSKMGKKDIIKVECPVDAIDLDILGYIDHNITVNGEYGNYTYFMLKDDVPMVGVTVTEYLNHALYPEYGKLAWDFAKHYSRNLDTLDVVYNPFVK